MADVQGAAVASLERASGSMGPSPSSRTRSPWIGFLIKRALGLVLTTFLLVTVTFLIVPLIPGDPAVSAAGPDATPQRIKQVRAELDLERPLAERYVSYLGGVLTGDLGDSFKLGVPVMDIVEARLPYTAALAAGAIALVLLIAVPLGLAVAVLTRGGRRRGIGAAFGFVTGGLAAIPPYVMATILVVVVAVSWELLPPAYTRSAPGESYILPVLALALGPLCQIARVVRREAGAVLQEDFMRTARGWRLSRLRTYVGYALPNLLTSTLTLTGLVLSSMLGGAVIVETVFSWPGVGSTVVRAILDKDYPVIQGLVLVIGLLAALQILIVDLLLGLIDPRTLGGRRG